MTLLLCCHNLNAAPQKQWTDLKALQVLGCSHNVYCNIVTELQMMGNDFGPEWLGDSPIQSSQESSIFMLSFVSSPSRDEDTPTAFLLTCLKTMTVFTNAINICCRIQVVSVNNQSRSSNRRQVKSVNSDLHAEGSRVSEQMVTVTQAAVITMSAALRLLWSSIRYCKYIYQSCRSCDLEPTFNDNIPSADAVTLLTFVNQRRINDAVQWISHLHRWDGSIPPTTGSLHSFICKRWWKIRIWSLTTVQLDTL